MRITMIFVLAVLAGCGPFGQVNQGTVVEYQKGAGLITLMPDSGAPVPVTIRTPADPSEMGPEPEAGKLIRLDPAACLAVVFDPATQGLRRIPYTLLSEVKRARPTTALPVVDRVHRTITVYLQPEGTLDTFSVADEFFALPDDTWKTGDVVRYYYKDPARALRLMNVSRTDLNKGGK